MITDNIIIYTYSFKNDFDILAPACGAVLLTIFLLGLFKIARNEM